MEELPLTGVLLCCTSVSQDVRTKLVDAATQMGAVHKLDLTSDVTHLIVGSITTAKYRYVAKERPDIKVLHPNWIEAVRESWMEGGDVDVAFLEKEHHIPPFTGLQICVTGFDNIDQRTYISTTLGEHGATYHGDLTKAVTHLIAAAPSGAKYKAAKLWGVTVVSLKWFEDSLYRGMALDESLYDPGLAEEEQGKGAFRLRAKPRTSLGKREREGSAPGANSEDISKKRLRRTASTRLESQSQDMWQDISAHSVGVEASELDQWTESGGCSTTHVSETTTGLNLEVKTESKEDDSRRRDEPPEGLFSGLYVLLHEFDRAKASRLQDFLVPNGACIVQSVTELEEASCNPSFKERYLLVPHVVADTSLRLPDVPAGTVTATEWWVERCVLYKRLFSPTEDVLSRPLWNVKVSGADGLTISTTGFAGVDLRQVAEAVRLMGATYQEKVLPSSSVLVSGSASIRKEKAFYANKHHIPVVSANWLWTCLTTKKIASLDKHALSLPAVDPKDFQGEPSTSSPAPSDLAPQNSRDSQKKDDATLKRLSSTRRKHATPSLSLHAVKPSPAAMLPRPMPFVHEDDPCSPPVASELLRAPTTNSASVLRAPTTDGASDMSLQPLKEVSPNLSPRKGSQALDHGNEDLSAGRKDRAKSASRTVSLERPASRTVSPEKSTSPPPPPPAGVTPDTEAHPPPRPIHQVTAELADLLHTSAASRPSSAAGAQPLQRRKNRPLGRAASGISNHSASASAQSERLTPSIPSELTESAADGFDVPREAPAPPSTQLGYETPEAEAHRLQMSKELGTKLQDDGGMRRLASLGTVKDTVMSSDAGVGNRVRGRHRTK
ncbi:protein kinase activating protein dpb11 [Vermiconidia calcicola]|uniref:Protein kinase activating protein dpb11 n=1 Tax=Vermiconidia calcicola TaxID=1690605 RepID=A0ACC3MR66_9PEZI|nr:protein kinase activating protein dpb11 [Vermiconidia calcicola]